MWKHFEETELEAEANSEATYFIQSWKRKQKYSTASTSLMIENMFCSIDHMHGKQLLYLLMSWAIILD